MSIKQTVLVFIVFDAMAEHHRMGHTWSIYMRSCPYGTERTALVASHLSDRVQSGVVNVHDPRQQCPQYLRGSFVSAGSEPGRHHLRSATNLNYTFP